MAAATTFTLRSDGLTWRQLDDSIIVLDLASSVYLSVTGAGTLVWAILARGSCTLDELTAAVLDEFDVSESEARADVLTFLEQLAERSLLT